MKTASMLMTSLACLALLGCDEDSGLTKRQVGTILEIQQSTQREQVSLSRARDNLEYDRHRWSEREREDPIIAQAIGKGALLVTCILPLLLIAGLLSPAKSDPSEEVVCDLLTEVSHADRPRLVEHDIKENRLLE